MLLTHILSIYHIVLHMVNSQQVLKNEQKYMMGIMRSEKRAGKNFLEGMMAKLILKD